MQADEPEAQEQRARAERAEEKLERMRGALVRLLSEAVELAKLLGEPEKVRSSASGEPR